MAKSVTAIRRSDLGRITRFDLMKGPDFLGRFSANQDRRRCWSQLTVPTALDPNSLTTAQMAEFIDHVYSDLFGDLAQAMWQECRVFLGDSERTDVVWFGDEKNRNRFHRLIARMKQRNSPYQLVRFETAARVGCVSFALEKDAPRLSGNWLTLLVTAPSGWTAFATDWALRRHADQELASCVDAAALAALLADTWLDPPSLAA